MAKTTHTYAVRLAVEQGGRVKAELVSVGDSGERSLKRIERSGERASRGLADLGGRVRFLKVGIGSLGAALAGVVSVGGLTALVNRSLHAADSIGKTADKIGVGVAALQELRYAAQLAGIEERTLDMALQRFTRRVAEAAKGTGEAKDALSSMGIALKDQNGNIRAAEDLLGDVADAFARVEDPAERVRLAFKLFDSEGVAMVNVLARGADALEETRRRARELGIVLDEDLVRNAEKAKDQLDTLGKVVSANLTRALLDLAPAIADTSEGLAGLAADAGVFYEQLKLLFQGDFNFENLSLRSTERIVAERRQELVEIARELKEVGDVAFVDDPTAWGRKVALERRLQERVEQYRQWSAKLAWLRQQSETDGAPVAPDASSTVDEIDADVKAAEDRARRLARIEQDLQRQLFEATHEGTARIRAEHARLVEEIQGLAEPDGSDRTKIDQLIIEAAALRDARLAEIARREEEAARKRDEANRKVIASLDAERAALSLTERARFIDEALRRLSAEATEAQHRQVRELAGVLYDEKAAQEAARKAGEDRQRLMERGRDLTMSLRTATEVYGDELADLKQLLDAGAIGQETYARAAEAAQDRMLRASHGWRDGARRALRDYADAAEDAGAAAEEAITRGLASVEDTLTEVFATGRFEFSRFADSLMADITRIAVRQAILAPAARFLEGELGGGEGGFLGDLFGLFHQGGVVGTQPPAVRLADPAAFRGAARLHSGGIAGMGLLPDEVPVIARRGELVVPPEKIMRERDLRPITVVMNVTTPDASGFRASQGQITADLARAMERARRNL